MTIYNACVYMQKFCIIATRQSHGPRPRSVAAAAVQHITCHVYAYIQYITYMYVITYCDTYGLTVAFNNAVTRVTVTTIAAG